MLLRLRLLAADKPRPAPGLRDRSSAAARTGPQRRVGGQRLERGVYLPSPIPSRSAGQRYGTRSKSRAVGGRGLRHATLRRWKVAEMLLTWRTLALSIIDPDQGATVHKPIELVIMSAAHRAPPIAPRPPHRALPTVPRPPQA